MNRRRITYMACHDCGLMTEAQSDGEMIQSNWISLLDRDVVCCETCRWQRKYGWINWPATEVA